MQNIVPEERLLFPDREWMEAFLHVHMAIESFFIAANEKMKVKEEKSMSYVLLILGFVLLIKGADFFVDGSSSVAKILKVPTIIIGLTVVAFGTSMPEASVSITAALQGKNDLAVSNVLGSNLFNLLVVLGACALVQPIQAKQSVLKKEFPFSIIVTAVLLVCMAGNFKDAIPRIVNGGDGFVLTRIGGVILLVLFGVFLASTIKDALKARNEYVDDEYEVLSRPKSALYIIVGLIGIVLGGEFVVDSASAIAADFGLSQTFIGLTIVALGTSLPELVTSIVAAKKGENDLALGNVIGSNLFNILLVLGASAAIFPITVDVTAIYDTIILAIASIFAYVCTLNRKEVNKIEGIMFLVVYAGFFWYVFTR